MPAPSKKSRMAKAKRQKGAATFTVVMKEASGSDFVQSNSFFVNRKGLNPYETAWAVKKYKSHRRIPEVREVRDALKALDLASKAT